MDKKTLLLLIPSEPAHLIATKQRTWVFTKRLIRFPCDELAVYSRVDSRSSYPNGAIVAIANIKEIKNDVVPKLWEQNELAGNPACMSEDEFYDFFKKDFGTVIKLEKIHQTYIPLEEITKVDPKFVFSTGTLLQYLSKTSPILSLAKVA